MKENEGRGGRRERKSCGSELDENEDEDEEI